MAHLVSFQQSTQDPALWRGRCSCGQFETTGAREKVIAEAEDHEKQLPEWIAADPRDPKWAGT